MASNHKLTGVLKGRIIASTGNADGKMNIGFIDGSTMTIKTAGSSNSAATGLETYADGHMVPCPSWYAAARFSQGH